VVGGSNPFRKKREVNKLNALDLVYFGILVIVGVSIFSTFDSSTTNMIPASATSARAAAGNVSYNSYQGFSTISSAPVILAAVVILGIVGMLMSRR
jgi:hypothetical protein